MPAYNAADSIGQALDSVALQTVGDWEIVVVDDGSTDATNDRIREWIGAHDHGSVKLIRQQNRGIGGARNTGVAEASGEFVAFLDSDDWWLPEKLESVSSFLRKHPEVDLVCHHEWQDSGPSSPRRHLAHGGRSTYRDLLFGGNCISTSATVVRREHVIAAGGFSENLEFNGAEDYDLWLRLARDGSRIAYLPEVLGVYRVHGQGITSNAGLYSRNVLNVVRAHLNYVQSQDASLKEPARRRWASALKDAGHAFMRSGDHERAHDFFKAAIRENFGSWRAWMLLTLNRLRLRI